jgi:hypothetical protein
MNVKAASIGGLFHSAYASTRNRILSVFNPKCSKLNFAVACFDF